ncbi:MAG: radical SAM protein [Thermodesulfobacteriota bacterium]|nr:radical SAM protein [Thermodesulfobacteriota bacterium]
MKICFINPPIEDFYSTSIRRQPLGILYLISSIKSAGYHVSFINGHSPKKHKLPIPAEFSYLNKYISNNNPALSFPFKNYYHFGLSFQEIEKQIKSTDADIYFISALFTPYYQETDEIIHIIKRVNPFSKIVVGGYHAALYPEYYLQKLDVDFVIIGEGEQSSVQLLDSLINDKDILKVPNLAFRKKDEMVKTEKKYIQDINAIPYPSRKFLKARDFKMYRARAVSMITSRGCPNKCDFCTGKIIWGKRYRARSIESVLSEIDRCIHQYEIKIINFEDDNIFAHKSRAVELLTELYHFQRIHDVSLDFTAMNGISIEQLDEEILNLMKQAGFRELNISLVSYSEQLQKRYNRPFDTKKFADIANMARTLGMNVRSYFILGLPNQTKEEIEATINFLKSLQVKIFPSVYYDVNTAEGQWKMQRSSAFFNETEHLCRDDLFHLYNRIRY